MNIPEITFGKLLFKSHLGDSAYTTSLREVKEEDIDGYVDALKSDGYTLYQSHALGEHNRFFALSKSGDAVYIMHYAAEGEARIVTEESSLYLTYSDSKGEDVCTALFTQPDLKDFGMSYVIRLTDGRFVIIDGGWAFVEDADNLYAILESQTEGRPIVIAAWIMTHPHLDHYRVTFPFMEKYGDLVTVEKMLYSFPDANEAEAEYVPALLQYEEMENIERLNNIAKSIGAPVYRCHTGQIYDIGGARFEVLFSPDDTFVTPVTGFNQVSLTFKIVYLGQSILITGDSQYFTNKFTALWGKYLKSDILQVPHHGFHGGTNQLFRLAAAPTIFNPTFEDDCFGKIDMKYSFNYDSWFSQITRDYYTGSTGHVTVTLPHTPRENGRELLDKLLEKYEVRPENIQFEF